MNKTLPHLLTALVIALTALPGISRAAPDGNDYIAVQVPDVTQAVTFFRDVLNCGLISGDDRAANADKVALMTCGRETTVEISRTTPGQSSKQAHVARQSLTLDADDASSVAAWLRTHRIPLIGSPTRVSSGPDTGKIAVSFLTPWGEPLRLVSRIKADDLLPGTMASSRIAAQ